MSDRSIANALRSWCVWLLFAALTSGPTLGQDSSFIRGDCNADGTYNIADPISILGILFSGAPAPVCNDACDCNDDGSLDIGDAICMLSGLFGNPAVPPAMPHPDCGADPTPDALGCASFEVCGMPPVAVIVADPVLGTIPLEVFFDGADSFDPDGTIVSYAWDFGDGQTGTGIFPTHTYTTIGAFVVTLTVTDDTNDIGTATTTITTDALGPPVMIESTSPTNGEDGVAVTRETIIRFDSQVQASTLTSASIYAQFSGVTLPTTVHVSPGAALVSQATLFYAMPLPGSSVINVFVDGDLILDSLGRAVDADEDGVEGGLGSFQFSTLSLTLLQGTAVCGRVFASEFDQMVGGQPVNIPLEGVTITIDGVDPMIVSAVTDELGSYRLEPVPAGTFFVHVDGRTVNSALIGGVETPTVFPDGPYYPFVGKPFTSRPSQETQLADIFLPLVDEGTLVAVSETEDTVICFPPAIVAQFPELDGVCITVPAGSLYSDDGTPGGMVGISPVNSNRLPGPLPPGLEFALVITVQTNGPTNFNVPAPICFPNLPDPVTGVPLLPGDETALWSFNHDTGQWEVAGPMTVTADGTQICTNPGVGILAPGWHAVNPGVPINGGDITDPNFDPRNPPNADGQEPVSDDGDAAAACTQGRKVYLHNGEENFERTDLVIPGRGDINFMMRRRYRSQLDFNGPLGHGWDFDYNDSFFVGAGNNLTRCNGRGKVDVWLRDAFGNYLPPFGYFRIVSRAATNLITMRSPNGYKRLYHPDGRLYAHEDRFGNRMVFEYDRSGNLELVVDPLGREIKFFFTTVAGKKRLTMIRDFIGREVKYFYDSNGDLVRVRTPSVTGTSTNNNFPNGREEVYTYSSGFAQPELNHNLLSVKLPEEVANGGPVAISWEYGTNPADPLTFDKVTAEHLGGGAVNASGVPAGGTITFEYSALNQGAPAGQFDLPRGKVLVTERNGNQYEYFVNELSHHIITRRLTRGLRPGEPAFYETRFYYDADGQMTRQVFPEGNEIQYTYDSSGPRAAQKNQIEVRHIADADRGGGEDLVSTTTYEPLFQRLRTSTGARGNATSFVPPIGTATPARYTLTNFFDYQEGSAQSILNLAQELEVNLDPDGTGPITALSVATALSENTDLNMDGVTNQKMGNVIRTEMPTVRLLDETGAVVMQPIVQEQSFNDFGLMTRSVDPEGNVTTFEYQPVNRPNGVRLFFSLFLPLPSTPGGYTLSSTIDATTSYRRTSTVPPAMLRTEYTFDQVGNRTSVRNPRGITTTTEYNQLNEPIVITRGADVSAAVANGELITGESALAYKTRIFYDHNGRITRSEVENRDSNTVGVGQYIDTTFEYDILDNLVRKSTEVDATTNLTWEYRYDGEELRTLVTQPEGNSTLTEYDERNLTFRVTRGFGEPEASTTQQDYDGNGNLIRRVDAEDNDGNGQHEVVTFTFDGHDRRIRQTDPLGNRVDYEFDVAKNLVRQTVTGHPAGSPLGMPIVLSDVFYRFDEHHRVYQEDHALFLSPGFAPVDPVVLTDHNSDGFVTYRTVHDALSRVVFTLDDDLQVTSHEFDGASRRILTVDPVGNANAFGYDSNSNVVERVDVDVAVAAPIAMESYTTRYVYDQFDRLVRQTDSAGQTTRWTYDSRDNTTQVTDPQGTLIVDPLSLFPGMINANGNVTQFFHDGLDRTIMTATQLRIGGSGVGAIDLSNPANPDGHILLANGYDGNSRLTSRTDDNGNATAFEYDALDRMTRQVNADSTDTEYFYDRDSNLVQVIDPNGSVTTNDYDALNRLIDITVVRGTGVVGSTAIGLDYDGLSRLTASTDNNGGAPQSCEYVYDSLSRLLEERQNGLSVSRVLAGDGRVLNCRYPGPQVLSYTYDANDRPASVSDLSGAVASWSWIGPGVRLLERSNANGTDDSTLDVSGTAVVGYDNRRRVVRQTATDLGGAAFVDRQYAYNRFDLRTLELRHDDFGLTDQYTYDSAYRLIDATYDQSGLAGATPRDLIQQVYAFDGVGNRTTVTEQTQSMGTQIDTYSSNEVNEYTFALGGVRAHDANGNLVAGAGRTYQYDYRNRLVAVRDASSDLIAEYYYFPDGRRARKTVYVDGMPGIVDTDTTFFYEGQRVVEDRDGSGAVSLATYIWDPRYLDCLVQLARTPNHPLGAATYYAHQNARGDVVALSDAGGSVAESYRFEDFGSPEASSTLGNPYLFQGSRYDAETGLYYLRARYMDPVTGRFLQRDSEWDPINAGNQYSFAGNSPISNGDPLGRNTQGRMTEEQRKHLASLHDLINEIRSSASYQLIGWNKDILQQAEQDLQFYFNQDTSWIHQGYDGGHGLAADLSGWADVDNSATYTAGLWEDGSYFTAALAGVVTAITAVDAASNFVPGVGQGKKAVKEGAQQLIEQGLRHVDDVPIPRVGYHATSPDVAPLIRENGFIPGSRPGRLGSGGTYVNDTPAGALAEFQHHNPGVQPEILRVEYTPGVEAVTDVAPRNYVDHLPLSGVDSVSAPSLRAPGTTNTNVLNGSVRVVE